MHTSADLVAPRFHGWRVSQRSTSGQRLGWHLRFAQEVPHVDLRESLAMLALLAAIPANRLAATALAELLSRRRSCERIAEASVGRGQRRT
jgi:hypothetical protein